MWGSFGNKSNYDELKLVFDAKRYGDEVLRDDNGMQNYQMDKIDVQPTNQPTDV